MGLSNTLRFIWNHPLLTGRRTSGLVRLVRWQAGVRLLKAPIVVPFVNDTCLVATQGMHAATGNYYVGLMEYKDMSFVLHALQSGDLFIDVGANVGTYSLCAASVGADVLAIEPVPETADALSRNISYNSFSDRIQILRAGLGRDEGTLHFTVDSGATNHVLRSDDTSRSHLELPVTTLDEALEGRTARIIKIDVEGFETEVLAGADKTLRNPELTAVIIELNGLGARYGYDDNAIHATLTKLDFRPVAYHPAKRLLQPLDGPDTSSNTIYVRDRQGVEDRLKHAPKYSVLGIER